MSHIICVTHYLCHLFICDRAVCAGVGMFECVCLQMCGRVVAVSLGELREQRARASIDRTGMLAKLCGG